MLLCSKSVLYNCTDVSLVCQAIVSRVVLSNDVLHTDPQDEAVPTASQKVFSLPQQQLSEAVTKHIESDSHAGAIATTDKSEITNCPTLTKILSHCLE